MVFSSSTFLFFFLPIVIILYFIVPYKAKNIVLLMASLIFYFCGEPKFIYLFISSILVNYIFGILIERSHKLIVRKVITGIAISINVLLIGLFKYADFIIKNINSLFSVNITLLKLVLPIGISFYTFQAISYIIDVYRGGVKAQKNFINLSLYISLFPQLIAGPIIRYQTINEELTQRRCSFTDFSYGVRRFIFGLSKKLLIADQVVNLWELVEQTKQASVLYYWLGAIGFSLQIYFDFSGYSDMAIGMGRMFGFHFPENFNHPFCSKSITEFWRRWHISLGTWFRDYLYIPLGGNRHGKLRWIFNLFVVWSLTGFWHGADWNFVLWGLFFGVVLMIEKLFLLELIKKVPSFFARIYTLLIVVIGFVVFNNNIEDAIIFIKSMIGLMNIPFISAETLYYLRNYLGLLVVAIVFSTDIPNILLKKITTNSNFNKIIDYIEPVVLITLFLLSVGYLVDSSFQPFLYFRF